jgi:hypothetical protein
LRSGARWRWVVDERLDRLSGGRIVCGGEDVEGVIEQGWLHGREMVLQWLEQM